MGLNVTVPGLYIVHCKCGNALRWRSRSVCVLGHKFSECNSLLTTPATHCLGHGQRHEPQQDARDARVTASTNGERG
jgi:hypothetical protein